MERSPSPALEMDYNQYEEEQYSDFPLSTEILPVSVQFILLITHFAFHYF